jgi:hypothetical protein
MEQTFGTENKVGESETIELFMNETNVEKQYFREKIEDCPSLQIEVNKISKNEKEVLKVSIWKLHAQKKIERPHNINSISWSFFYVNDHISGCECCTKFLLYFFLQRSSGCIKLKNKFKEMINLILKYQWNKNI